VTLDLQKTGLPGLTENAQHYKEPTLCCRQLNMLLYSCVKILPIVVL